MINIKGIFNPKIGDKVTVKSNISGHGYAIGREYNIVNEGNGNYLLSDDVNDVDPQGVMFGHPHHQRAQSWVSLQDLDIKLNKESLISDLSDVLEFLKDYEDKLENSSKLEKEFKVYHILKEVKSEKSDFDKISIISKYL